MDEQMIEGLFAAIAHGDEDHRVWLHEAIVAFADGKPVPPPRGQGRSDAAHSVIAGKVAELIEALIEARSAIATWSETPCEHDYKKHDALCYIDAALAPYPERRHE